ncbi:MAG: LysR substrate-binding domain-containing protein [Comamonadaceae bacterium]|nr:LysR substrate-binding domain-containing protein [Comamonadaceae bacterium]
MLAMVAQGMGVSLVPRTMAATGMRGVAFVALQGPPKPSSALLAWNPAHACAALESFIACARQVLGEQAARARGQGRRQ